MGEVARAAGVSRSTVSRALRDDPSIPAAKCREIKLIAGQLGYRPNPLVSTLMARIHEGRRHGDPDYIAWLDLWPDEEYPPAVHMLQILAGARQRARELGYAIQIHHAGATPISTDRLRQILLARSQWGFIIPPVPEHAMVLPLGMDGLTGVTIGTTLLEPLLPRVTTDHFRSAEIAWTMMRRKGFKRIGLAVSPRMNSRVSSKWLGGYLATAFCSPDNTITIPPLLVAEAERERFDQWIREHRPDAVLLADQFIGYWVQDLRRTSLASLAPAVAWLTLEEGARNAWGLDYQANKIGAAAVDMVVAQLHRNERGSPPSPRTLLVESVWAER